MDMDSQLSTSTEDILSISKIESLPWAEAAWDTIQSTLRTGFLRWCQLLIDIGVDKIDDSTSRYTDKVNNLCLTLITELETHKSEILETIEELFKRLQSLCYRLQIKMPKVGEDKTPLIESWHELDKKVKQFEEILKTRESEVQVLRNRQLELCESLGKAPRVLKDNPLPSAAELEEFQNYLENLEEEKFTRTEQFLTVKEEITGLVKELNFVPSTDFEKLVICGSDKEFAITNSNMKQLNSLYDSLTQQLQAVKDEVAELRSKINDLWDKLEIDIMEREDFRSKLVGHSLETLEALKVEYKRCEEIKKANIKIFIDKLRDELLNIWEKCHCSDSQRRQFQFFNSDCFNEDLLQLHEIAVGEWMNFYEQNKELINLLEKHKQLWERMRGLEQTATNSDRYKNRGGKLLKEEKERNKLNKLIPKIEEDLMNLAAEYEERNNGKVFTTFGKSVQEYIDDLYSERENVMKTKLSARKQQREQVQITPAKSKCNLFPSTSTASFATPVPLSAAKRKVLGTPNSAIVNKRAKLAPVDSAVKSHKKLPLVKVTRASTERKKRLSKRRQRRISQVSRENSSSTGVANDTVSTEYHDFQNDLSSKEDCRSTILPEEVNIKVKSIRKTPTKPPRVPISFRVTPRTPKSPRTDGSQLSTCRSNIRLLF